MEGIGVGHSDAPSSVIIEQLNDGKNRGVRVVFTIGDAQKHISLQTAAKNIGWMVDDVAINALKNERIEVILTKWVMRRQS